jgi:hypothetical protein
MTTSPQPNFLIVGAARSGTTSLYTWLQQHPEVFMPAVKELNFFVNPTQARMPMPNYSRIVSWDRYLAMFAGAAGKKAIGEASPAYLAAPESPNLIYERLGKIRIIMILRDPMERAFSAYVHRVMHGLEPVRTFNKALRREMEALKHAPGESERPISTIGYCPRGLYYEQVLRYFQTFGRESVRVFLFEDLVTNPRELYADVCRFIGVDDSFQANMVRTNAAKFPRFRGLQCQLRRMQGRVPVPPVRLAARAAMRLNLMVGREKERLPAEVSDRLAEYYRDNLTRLSELIQRDLSNWPSCAKARPMAGVA